MYKAAGSAAVVCPLRLVSKPRPKAQLFRTRRFACFPGLLIAAARRSYTSNSNSNLARANNSILGQELFPDQIQHNMTVPYSNGLESHSRSHSPTDFDTSFDDAARAQLKVRGLMPPSVENYELQKARCLEQINMKSNSIDKYSYLSNLRNTNVNLFYRLLLDNMQQITPYVYTPTVGEACVKWSHIYTQPEGLYLSYNDRGNLRAVLDNWPQEKVEITVVTDGSRILGLGDLGVGGMGIPVGKLALYTGCAGIHPERTLPICLDFGTDNEANLKDPLYMGAKMNRIPEDQQMEFMDEMMIALNDKWPGLCVQFEDFKNPFPSLARYRNTYTCFNDDIQGTGAVILGGMISAFKNSSVPLRNHRLVFMGAGSAAVGVAKQICDLFIRNGIPEEQAKAMFWLVDSKGLVTDDRGDKLQDHKLYFSRKDNNREQFQTLEEVLDYVQPTALLGLCTIGGVFTERIVRKMAAFNDEPIIFPLSNPSSKSECTYEDAMKWTDNRVVFASGSPFPPVEVNGVMKTPGQGNNM
jgi:malate dehydrogenase (oxaloacetate-decarboxylating)(NADP+)